MRSRAGFLIGRDLCLDRGRSLGVLCFELLDVRDGVADGTQAREVLVGIFTPYLSSVCTAISTIDSESMSRSSTNDFSMVTSDGSMPVTSSMISAMPAMSCSWVAATVWFPSLCL